MIQGLLISKIAGNCYLFFSDMDEVTNEASLSI